MSAGMRARQQRRTSVQRPHVAVPPIVSDVLSAPGEALAAPERERMESRFGHDFRHVRIHADGRARASARAIGASAYTLGQHVVLGADRVGDRQRQLAHELAHVVQQRADPPHAPSPLRLDEPQGSAEDDAIRRSAAALSGGPLPGPFVPPASAPTIHRQKGPVAATSPSAWTLGDLRVNFDIVLHKNWEASFLMIGGPATTGPGFEAWSNRRVFSIVPPEKAWLHTNYWVDTAEHPLPPDERPFSVTNDIKFMTASGKTTVDAHYKDDNPLYQAPGSSLRPKLGWTSPAAPDMPVHELPLDEGGDLVWRAGFRFPMGGQSFEVGGRFEVRAPGLAATEPRAAPGPTAVGPASSDAPEKKPEAKGQPLPSAASAQKAPAQAVGEIKALTELIKKTSEAAQKDPLVAKLRDLLSGLQPFMDPKAARKAIDDAIESLVKKGVDAGVMAILQAVTGKSPSAVPESRTQTGPDVSQKDLGEHILKGPAIPIKDAPALPPKLSFEYRGAVRSYAPGAKIKFTLVPPDNFYSLSGAKRLVIVAEANRKEPNPDRFGEVLLESASPKSIELTAPPTPGKYVFRVNVGLGYDYSSVQEFEVVEPKR